MESGRLERQELADAVIDAAINVLQDILSYRPTSGQLQITPIQFTRDDITIVSRISGDVSAQLFLGLTPQSAVGIVSQMSRTAVGRLGQLEISTLVELGSMITDSALALLEDQGAICYSVWTGAVQGQDERISPVSLPALAVPLRLITGDINLNVILESQAPFGWASAAARLRDSTMVTIPAIESSLSLAA
ncbi:MAG: chemotaxis protein CheX [Armatimonadota bacterium]|jgi:CheY-specific phosphatase CheX